MMAEMEWAMAMIDSQTNMSMNVMRDELSADAT
jgi:hypothetical protein